MGMWNQIIPRPTYSQSLGQTLLLLPLVLLGALIKAIVVVVGRFISGWPMDGVRRSDAGWFRYASVRTDASGGGRLTWWGSLPYVLRGLIRIGGTATALALAWVYSTAPHLVNTAVIIAAVVAIIYTIRASRERWKTRHFRADYAEPLGDVLRDILGWDASTHYSRFLHVSPELSGLTPLPGRKKTPSEFEKQIRYAYGQWIVRPIRWPFDWLWRWRADYVQARAAARIEEQSDDEEDTEKTSDLLKRSRTAVADYFTRPTEEKPPRIEIKAARKKFLEPAEKESIKRRVTEKLGLGDLEVDWDQRGKHATAVFTKIKRPPEFVGYDRLIELLQNDELEPNQRYVGAGADGEDIIFDVEQDSPHWACSAPSGAGKTELAKILAIQSLWHGDKIVILDRKGSHIWAKDLPGVIYCLTQEQMDEELIKLAEEAEDRNLKAFNEGVFPDHRIIVIFEEMNSTVQWLQTWWEKIRDRKNPDHPKKAPVVDAYQTLMFMGRSAMVHLFGVAQMLSAKAAGGPEARENFGVRFIARWTANAWRMLLPEIAMPRKSKHRGRWQMGISGEATEVQIAYAGFEESRKIAEMAARNGGHVTGYERGSAVIVADVPTSPTSETVGPDLDSPGHDDRDTAETGTPDVDIEAVNAEADAEFESTAWELTLDDALNQGFIVASSRDAAKKQVQRHNKTHTAFKLEPLEKKRGNANLYAIQDLMSYKEFVANQKKQKNQKK